MNQAETLQRLAKEGYCCAQILLISALEYVEKVCSELVRAVGGLCGGLGGSGLTCGALSGGACFLSYFAGKGKRGEAADPNCKEMIQRLTKWFEDETRGYGGCD